MTKNYNSGKFCCTSIRFVYDLILSSKIATMLKLSIILPLSMLLWRIKISNLVKTQTYMSNKEYAFTEYRR